MNLLNTLNQPRGGPENKEVGAMAAPCRPHIRSEVGLGGLQSRPNMRKKQK